MTGSVERELRERIDAIEAAYEFMLAYAAQGVTGEETAGAASEIRDQLSRAENALEGLVELLRQEVRIKKLESADRYLPFSEVVEQDVQRLQAAIEIVLAQRTISSQLIDNLNALIHLRSLLTDLFLIDEILKLQQIQHSKT